VTYVLLALSFVLLVAGAIVFTNAIEWAGQRLDVGEGATGSILAAVATALPESLVPIVAIIGGREAGNDVALGAIIGAPFMLATIAMALVGISAFLFRARRKQGNKVDADRPTLRRDFSVFFVAFGLALVLGLTGPKWLRIVAAVALVAMYAIYVWRTVVGAGKAEAEEDELDPLYIDTEPGPPATWRIVTQVVVGIGMIVGGAHLFVEEVTVVADKLGVSTLVLALIVAPLATELPEKFNSFIWVREGKDALALGNITGAMVFQSSIPVAVGLAFTPWALDTYAVLAACIALAGGALAFWATTMRCKFGPIPMLTWAGLFLAFLAYVGVSTT
jgi:cation:H+ antiporter